jgi:hypothetical protein
VHSVIRCRLSCDSFVQAKFFNAERALIHLVLESTASKILKLYLRCFAFTKQLTEESAN